MIKNIVFDLGGVLVDFNPRKVVDRYFEGEDAEFILKNMFFSHEWSEIDRGTLTPDEGFAKYKNDLKPEVYDRILDIICNWGDYMPPFEDTYEVIKSLKAAGYGIYLLSNVPPYFHAMISKVPALGLFDGFVASADIKMLKPEPEIFNHLLEKFSLSADECIFIDDMRVNVEGAIRCGLHGHCFENHDIPALINALRENGVNI